ncbi:MAG: acetolactate synthase small subunit [Candidatus Firestonebacteria bacterium]
MRHTISVLVENKSGVLSRISGLFSSRGFNIESLTVGETEDSSISRITIVVSGDDIILEQVSKQLNKLIDVIKVIDMTKEKFINRELALIKVNINSVSRPEVIQIVDVFRGKIIDISSKTFTVEITGTFDKINAFLELVRPFGIKEMVRTGAVALSREWQNSPGEKHGRKNQ